MTYSLNTLNMPNGTQTPQQLGFRRFVREALLVAGFFVFGFWLMAMVSYSTQDVAWTSSGAGDALRNWCGRFGAWVADLSYFMLGFSVWWILAVGLRLWLALLARWMRGSVPDAVPNWKHSRVVFFAGLACLICASCSLEWSRLYRFEALLPGHAGGVLGYVLGPLSSKWLGFAGSGLAWISIGVLGASLVFRFSWGHLAERLGAALGGLIATSRAKREMAQDVEIGKQAVIEREDIEPSAGDFLTPVAPPQPALVTPAAPAPRKVRVEPKLSALDAVTADAPGTQREVDWIEPVSAPSLDAVFIAADEAIMAVMPVPSVSAIVPVPSRPRAAPVPIEPAVAVIAQSERIAKEKQNPLFNELPDSPLPQVSLLDPALVHQETVSPDILEMTSRLIEKKLKDFGVVVRVVLASPGPVITRYEIEPATGVKGSQIVGLAKDLARSLSLVSIRVVETIPGKNYMALELPNARRQTIRLSEILGSKVYNEAKSMLTMGMGKDIIGNPIVADLAKMPHCLVAGTTGSGKSVGINAMILSLLYKAEARDVRLLIIDPKMLEMSVYEGIPHLLAPVVTDMKQAAHGLNWCVAEMERRYKLLSKMGVRNLAGYNTKIDDATAREEFIYNPFSLTPESPEPLDRLPHIVVVIDELADLMMVVGKKIEELIARLAQKARAAGIHLILATQRPSVDVITGLIKANIPTRIAFQVSSKIDSRTILDQMGAEALLGMGDMLYMPSGTGLPIRVHGAFVSDEEVHRVVSYLKSQGEPNYIDGVLEGGTVDGEDGPSGGDGDSSGEKDPMYDQAVEVVLKNRKASISLVQRHLKIGYNRAARLVEDMEKAGLVSAMSTSGQRDILVPARAE